MSSKDSQLFNKDFKYLIDCHLSESTSKSDSIRSKYFQMNALRDQLTAEEYNGFRSKLLNQLSEEMDKNDGKNTYISEAMLSWHSSQRPNYKTFQSSLYGLSEQQLCQRLDIKAKDQSMDDSNDCQIVSVVLRRRCDDNKQQIPPEVIVSDGINTCGVKEKRVKSDIIERLGSFRDGFDKVMKRSNSSQHSNQTLGYQSSTNRLPSSPTRVSGIFRTTHSPKRIKTKETPEECDETQPKRPSFMTGFEKSVVDAVKSGSIGVRKAREVLNSETRNAFKNPIKAKNFCVDEDEVIDPNLKNIDKNMIRIIENEIISNLEPIEWSDVAGLEFAKNKIHEIAVLPLLRPDLFNGLRKPPKGILLFGPPGTGKTYLGRCIASQTKSTFFSITVSALNSKWIGEGEKAIRAMFAVARARQPSVIFIDEIDSLMKSRSDTEHESSRRMKTEFLAQFEGVATDMNDRLLIIGATNRPQELDDAARRRLTAKLYIPLPEERARQEMLRNSLKTEKHCLTDEQIESLAQMTDGYSGADMRDLCREAAMVAMRELTKGLSFDRFKELSEHDIRGIGFEDFVKAFNSMKPSVCVEDIKQYEEWNQLFGNK